MLLRVVDCAVHRHDPQLAVLAAVVCAFACYTTAHMLSRVGAVRQRVRPAWIGAAALAFGMGVWATHFIAMLAFHAGAPVGFEADITLASLALAICLSFASFALLIETRSAPLGALGASVLLVAGIGGMHYIGMTAMVMPGLVHFAAGGVAASIMAGLLFSLAGLLMFRRGHLPSAAALLCLAVCGLHFTGMASLRIDAAVVNPGRASLPPGLLALAVAAAGLLVLALSLTGSLLDQRLVARAAHATPRGREFPGASFEGIRFATEEIIADANAALGSLLRRVPETLPRGARETVFDRRAARHLPQPEHGAGPTGRKAQPADTAASASALF